MAPDNEIATAMVASAGNAVVAVVAHEQDGFVTHIALGDGVSDASNIRIAARSGGRADAVWTRDADLGFSSVQHGERVNGEWRLDTTLSYVPGRSRTSGGGDGGRGGDRVEPVDRRQLGHLDREQRR